MRRKSKQGSDKKDILVSQVVRTSHYKGKQRGFSQKGLSFVELIVTIGMTVLLASIGYVAYMYYFQVTGKLNALHQVGAHVLERIQICTEESVLNTGNENLLPVDGNGDGDTVDPEDWKGCDSKERLNLVDCDGCEEPLVRDDPVTGSRRICMTIKNGKFSMCVGYRPVGGAINRFKITINRKVCVQARGLTSTACVADSDCASGEKCVTISGVGQCEDPSGRSAVWPFMACEEDADCGTGLNCLESLGECQTYGIHIKCV